VGKVAVKGVEIAGNHLNESAILKISLLPPMPTPLRRLLNHLPLPQSGGELYVRSSWHKPSQYDQLLSRPPFQAFNKLRADHFRRGLLRRRLFKSLLRWGLMFGAAWIVIESVRALALL
jgi:hypothetical protein